MKRAEFAKFYEQAKDPCFRALLVTVSDREAAEELLAEAFTRAWGDWRTVQSHPSPRAWVVRTALNLHIDGFRRAATGRKLAHLVAREDAYEDKPDIVDPALLAALKSLPEQQRLVVAYRVLLDLDTKQTAVELGIAASTVPTHLKRGLATLRRHLAHDAASTAAAATDALLLNEGDSHA